MQSFIGEGHDSLVSPFSILRNFVEFFCLAGSGRINGVSGFVFLS